MLLRMLPDQVTEHWDEIKMAIYHSLPVYTGERGNLMNDILIRILVEDLTVWVSYQMEDNITVVDAVLTTSFTYLDQTRNLLIYTMFGYSDISDKSWVEIFDAGWKFAKANGCSNIISYADNPAILERAHQFNCRVTNFITIPIGG